MKMKLQIKPEACILWTLMLFLLPIQWISACLCAAGFHELCHVLSVKLCGGQITRLEFGANGAEMETDQLENAEAVFCTMAGPLGGLLLTMTARWFPRLAFCALIHSLFNLLPILPLDGGRILKLLLERRVPRYHADNICRWIGGVLTGIILAMGIGFWICGLGLLPLFLGFLLLHRAGFRKIPCKQGQVRVQ